MEIENKIMPKRIILPSGMKKKIVKTEMAFGGKYRIVYAYMLIDSKNGPTGLAMLDKYAETVDRKIIGSTKMADFLFYKIGLSMLEKANPNDKICSIGLHKEEQKWYGWGHLHIKGFGVGDKYFNKNLHKRDNIIIENMEMAKQSAINFAKSVYIDLDKWIIE